MFRPMRSRVALVVLLAACAPPAHVEKSKDGLDVVKWTALVDRAADLVVADQSDCSKMAKDITELMKTNKDLVTAANHALGDRQDLPADAKDRIGSDVKRMMPGVEACGAEASVQSAFKLAAG